MSAEHAMDTRVLLDGYAGEFSDGSPKGWIVSKDDRGYAFTLPNGALIHSVELQDESVWTQIPQKDSNTTILWRNSLAYLVRLFEFELSQRSVETARNVVESFLRWIEDKSAEDPKSLKSGSLDHQGALRIRTLMSLISTLSRTGDSENFEVFQGLFNRLIVVEERLLDHLDLYQPNNHGIMLGMAHLHASTLFPASAQLRDASDWVKALYETLGQIIDADGIASENTPIYQVFYVSLIEDVLAFLVWSGQFPGKVRIFQLLLRAAQIGVQRQLLPNGAVPPIGDSPGGMQHRFRPLLGKLWSPANGLAITSSESHYLSFIAGFKSVIHKQLDELSVCWWLNGEFVLRDAGLLSYDQSDLVAASMRGHQGHSLPTYVRFDSWTTRETISFGKNSSRLRAHLISEERTADSTKFLGKLNFDGNKVLERNVSLFGTNRLSITDSFTATTHGDALVRFVFDPSLKVESHEAGSGLVLRSANRRVVVKFRGDGTKSPIGSVVKETHVAIQHYSAAATKEILITAVGTEGPFRIETEILVEDI
ncbi:heparinase II/III family protein [Paeniglutamicibacter sp.]|uniref:heparinase II/III domain-containing protein n=1 Tax=Paeniglutamicibacter sp. TaxID=1934391 RepID=UPI003989471B